LIRTALAGNLSSADVGKDVVLAGWVASRRDHGGVAFLDLRDSSGIAQVVVRDTTMAQDLRDEYCIAVTGTVELRPEGNSNPDIASGDIEVITKELTVLSESAPLPFQIDDRTSVNDEIRLKYRYLDLRRKSAGDALRMRSKVSHIARNVLFDEDFVEVETPHLDSVHTRRSQGLFGSCSPKAWALVCVAAVASIV